MQRFVIVEVNSEVSVTTDKTKQIESDDNQIKVYLPGTDKHKIGKQIILK